MAVTEITTMDSSGSPASADSFDLPKELNVYYQGH